MATLCENESFCLFDVKGNIAILEEKKGFFGTKWKIEIWQHCMICQRSNNSDEIVIMKIRLVGHDL